MMLDRIPAILGQLEAPPPEPVAWLTLRESCIYTGRDAEHIKRVPTLHTKRERSGKHTRVLYDGAELAQVFRVKNARVKLVLLDCTRGQLERELKASTDAELTEWIGKLLVFRPMSWSSW
jgi:hypothetical protein